MRLATGGGSMTAGTTGAGGGVRGPASPPPCVVRYLYRERFIEAADDDLTTWTVDGIKATFPSLPAARAAVDAECADEFRARVRASKGRPPSPLWWGT